MTTLRRSRPEEGAGLLALWERSVRATHGFLRDGDVLFYKPMVKELLRMDFEIWVVCGDADAPLGFMALDGATTPAKLEALFIDPAASRKGLGTLLVVHAQERYAQLALDANEQNPGAVAFYRKLGFIETGSSPVDGAGKPFPLIHMAWERTGG